MVAGVLVFDFFFFGVMVVCFMVFVWFAFFFCLRVACRLSHIPFDNLCY